MFENEILWKSLGIKWVSDNILCVWVILCYRWRLREVGIRKNGKWR